MDLIRDAIEWFASEGGSALASLFPLAMVGLLGLYLLWLVIGYLRVSQVGLHELQAAGQVAALPPGADAGERPRGVPYCAADALAFPPGARFCSQCEQDLSLDCTNCGATLTAADASCYRCGTRTGPTETALLG
jgi:hypothetical protein